MHTVYVTQMAHRTACSTRQVGRRSRRYQDGWDSANSRIYLLKETLSRLHTEQDLSSGNDIAVFLLKHNQVLTDQVAAIGPYILVVCIPATFQHVSKKLSAILTCGITHHYYVTDKHQSVYKT